MVFPLLICGIGLMKYCILPWTNQSSKLARQRAIKKTHQHQNEETLQPRWSSINVTTKAKLSHFGALPYIFEDNEAVIKISFKSRSPTMRLVSRTHRVALDWLFDRVNLDPKIHIKHVDTKNQLADIFTKGQFHPWTVEPPCPFVQHHGHFTVCI